MVLVVTSVTATYLGQKTLPLKSVYPAPSSCIMNHVSSSFKKTVEFMFEGENMSLCIQSDNSVVCNLC